MSSLAFNLLSHFLAEKDMVLVAAIINDKIKFAKSPFHDTAINVNSYQLISFPNYSPQGWL
jgi:hypothetical protein